MKMKDPKRIVTPLARLLWRAFSMLMRLHEKPYTKRAGVAGLRARGLGFQGWDGDQNGAK
nr:hypothetical protein [Enterobacter roggenkampii]